MFPLVASYDAHGSISIISKCVLVLFSLLQVSEDNKKVRRHPEMPIPEMNEERRKDLLSRTVYAKGFPKDSTLDDLIKFLKQYEETENIIMRRYVDRQTKKRLFKGSIFVTFKTKEQVRQFNNFNCN